MRASSLRLVIAGALVLGGIWMAVERWASLTQERPPLNDSERRAALAEARTWLDGARVAPAHATGAWRGVMTVWCEGRARWREQVTATGEGGLALPPLPEYLQILDGGYRKGCRVKLDVEIARGPIFARGPELLTSLALVPGLDGIGVDLDGREALLTPDELIAGDLLTGRPLLPGVDVELGLDVGGALRSLAAKAGVSAREWRRVPHHLFRFRCDEIVEPVDPTHAPLRVVRGHLLDGPPLTAANMMAAARRGGEYLLGHEHPDGTFDYEYFPVADANLPEGAGYSLPRHAGAAFYLAELFAATRDDRFRDGAARALRWLKDRPPPGCDRPDLACVGDSSHVEIGSASLTLLAAVEYHRGTGDEEFQPWALRLAQFLLAMQKGDGDFCHLYDAERGERDEHTVLLYFSGEATFALARLANDLVDPPPPAAAGARAFLQRAIDEPSRAPARYVTAVDRALDHLTGAAYAHLAGQFYFGEDHWTCLATDEAYDFLSDGGRRDRYGDFCEGFAAFQRRAQFTDGSGPVEAQPDLRGAYGFTSLIAPHATPVGSRSEAIVATLRLARRRGHEAAAREIATQLRDGFRFLLDRQLTPDAAWMMPRPDLVDGGWLMSDVKPMIRIDFVQHAGSSLLTGAGVLED